VKNRKQPSNHEFFRRAAPRMPPPGPLPRAPSFIEYLRDRLPERLYGELSGRVRRRLTSQPQSDDEFDQPLL
jgi:hypothetical protein